MNTGNIFRDGVLIDVDISYWSGAKALRPEDLGLKASAVADAFKLGRKFLVPADVIRSFRRLDSKARRIVDEGSFPFPIGNAHFIPRKSFEKTIQNLEECKQEYMQLVDELIENYDKYREEMVPVYREAAEQAFLIQTPQTHEFGPEYDREKEKQVFVEDFLERIESFYPPAATIRKKFGLEWSLYEISLPRVDELDAHQIIQNENNRQFAEQEYRRQMHEKMETFVNDAVSVLRQETVEVCGRISANLKEGKIVQGRTLQTLKDFVDRFSSLNFVGDATVESQLETLRAEILDKYPVQKFNEDKDLQAELRRKLGEIAETAAQTHDLNGITGQYRRKIQWQDEEEEAKAAA